MQSIVSYPDRGAGGNNRYRGNCSPRLITDFINFFNIEEIADYMCGSGTTQDAAAAVGIPSVCKDLRTGYDLLHNNIQERPQAIFFHPPYWDMISYSGGQYSAEEVQEKYGYDPLQSDLSRHQPWETFLKELNYCILKQFEALEKGGLMAVLVGDIRRNRKLYPMAYEMVHPGERVSVIIKNQHNCVSDGRRYAGKFVPIVHETMLIFRKLNAIQYDLWMPTNQKVDMRDRKESTWKDIVLGLMEESHGAYTLDELYRAVEGHAKTRGNLNWRAKVRQTLNMNKDLFRPVARGVWQRAA